MEFQQAEAAELALAEWLSYPTELGKYPARMKLAKVFEYNNMRYYIFKYKKNFFGPWLVGVSGGYEDDGLENCGHVFSEFEKYNPTTAEKHCIQLIRTVMDYWIARAHEEAAKNGIDINEFL